MNFDHVMARQDGLRYNSQSLRMLPPRGIIATMASHLLVLQTLLQHNHSTDRLAHKNRITEKTFSYAGKQVIKTVRNSPVVNGRHVQQLHSDHDDRSAS
jgi:hypothetical protein